MRSRLIRLKRAYEDVTAKLNAAQPGLWTLAGTIIGNPRRRFIVPHSEEPILRLGSMSGAPPGYEPGRDRRVREVNSNSVVDHAAGTAWGHGPAISARVLIDRFARAARWDYGGRVR